MSDLQKNFDDLKLKVDSESHAVEIAKLNKDVEDLNNEVRRIQAFMFIMLIILPIKIIVISIQSVRFAKYLNKKKTKFVRSFSKPFGEFKPEKNLDIVVDDYEESDNEAQNSRTITPRSMRSIYDELQECEMALDVLEHKKIDKKIEK